MIYKILILFFLAYIAGSINFAILLFKVIKKDDPRTKFSGNAGTTNVYRIAGKFWAAAVFLLDIGRAVGVAATVEIEPQRSKTSLHERAKGWIPGKVRRRDSRDEEDDLSIGRAGKLVVDKPIR